MTLKPLWRCLACTCVSVSSSKIIGRERSSGEVTGDKKVKDSSKRKITLRTWPFCAFCLKMHMGMNEEGRPSPYPWEDGSKDRRFFLWQPVLRFSSWGKGEMEKGSDTNWAPTMLSPSIYVPFSPYCIHLTYICSFLFHRWETEVVRDSVACPTPESCYVIGSAVWQWAHVLVTRSHCLRHFASVLSWARSRGHRKKSVTYR